MRRMNKELLARKRYVAEYEYARKVPCAMGRHGSHTVSVGLAPLKGPHPRSVLVYLHSDCEALSAELRNATERLGGSAFCTDTMNKLREAVALSAPKKLEDVFFQAVEQSGYSARTERYLRTRAAPSRTVLTAQQNLAAIASRQMTNTARFDCTLEIISREVNPEFDRTARVRGEVCARRKHNTEWVLDEQTLKAMPYGIGTGGKCPACKKVITHYRGHTHRARHIQNVRDGLARALALVGYTGPLPVFPPQP